MSKKRIIFYSLFGAYQLAGFIFTVIIDHNASALFSMAGHISLFKYLSFLGVVLLVIDVIWSWRQNGKVKREVEEFKHENNTLKAKIYDFRKPEKKSGQPHPSDMDLKPVIAAELQEASQVLTNFLNDSNNISKIELASRMIAESVRSGGKVISCGNGGSHCDAMHFAEELTGRYRENRKAIPAICISDPSHISCVSNDYGYEFVFSRYLEALGNKGDVLFGLSTSGNSANVLRAAQTAKEKGMKVIALTGKDGGKLAPLADIELRVSHFGYADRIQEVHIKIIHILMLLIEKQVL